ncbi:Intermediate filament protein, partial [Nowakowskiella sp. JEL0078]
MEDFNSPERVDRPISLTISTPETLRRKRSNLIIETEERKAVESPFPVDLSTISKTLAMFSINLTAPSITSPESPGESLLNLGIDDNENENEIFEVEMVQPKSMSSIVMLAGREYAKRYPVRVTLAIILFCYVFFSQWIFYQFVVRIALNLFMIVSTLFIYAWWVWLFRWSPLARHSLFKFISISIKSTSMLIFGESISASPILAALSYPDSQTLPALSLPDSSVSATQTNVFQDSMNNHSINWWAMKYTTRSLAFTSPEAWRQHLQARQFENNSKYNFTVPLQLENNSRISKIFEDLLSYVQRDFIDSWYRPYVSPVNAFPSHLGHLLRYMITKVDERVEGVDFVQFIIDRIVPLVTLHIRDSREAESGLLGTKFHRMMNSSILNSEDHSVDSQLAKHYRSGKVHPAISSEPVSTLPLELNYLRKLTEKILKIICPENELKSKIIKVMLREVLVCRILQPVVEYLADPDYWNQSIDQMMDYMLSGQETVLNRIQEALNQQAEFGDVDDEDYKESNLFGKDSATFQDFLRSIKDCHNMLDACRIHDTITLEIKKRKRAIANFVQDSVQVRETNIYIKRLQIAKKRIEARIQILSNSGRSKRTPTRRTSYAVPVSAPPLRYILEGTANSNLQKFFMDFIHEEGKERLIQ